MLNNVFSNNLYYDSYICDSYFKIKILKYTNNYIY